MTTSTEATANYFQTLQKDTVPVIVEMTEARLARSRHLEVGHRAKVGRGGVAFTIPI